MFWYYAAECGRPLEVVCITRILVEFGKFVGVECHVIVDQRMTGSDQLQANCRHSALPVQPRIVFICRHGDVPAVDPGFREVGCGRGAIEPCSLLRRLVQCQVCLDGERAGLFVDDVRIVDRATHEETAALAVGPAEIGGTPGRLQILGLAGDAVKNH